MTTLFRRRKTSAIGLKGFISFQESLITGTVACITSFAADPSDVCFLVLALSIFVLGECIRASTSRASGSSRD